VSHVFCSKIGENLAESEYYHSALRWFDEERDELESSPNNTKAVRLRVFRNFIPRHGITLCFGPASRSRPTPSPAESPELDSSRRRAEQGYLQRSDCFGSEEKMAISNGPR
jgi:hypothetical protein